MQSIFFIYVVVLYSNCASAFGSHIGPDNGAVITMRNVISSFLHYKCNYVQSCVCVCVCVCVSDVIWSV